MRHQLDAACWNGLERPDSRAGRCQLACAQPTVTADARLALDQRHQMAFPSALRMLTLAGFEDLLATARNDSALSGGNFRRAAAETTPTRMPRRRTLTDRNAATAACAIARRICLQHCLNGVSRSPSDRLVSRRMQSWSARIDGRAMPVLLLDEIACASLISGTVATALI